MVGADTDVVVARPLTELLALTYGPSAVLGERLSDAAAVEQAYIYGSWAARYSGEPGRVPRDVTSWSSATLMKMISMTWLEPRSGNSAGRSTCVG
ncbi:hypothetical protein Pmi06nite_40990 [Planotetraspora mira]|uniref:Uncharacterized protein n=1 Tax=Planotetraspora mira TaxID=58121 RepID=A0A8J3TSQ3_9ACTN|nr:hypothetical protein Pmi06nite_40990 [Planotetraspora mira]